MIKITKKKNDIFQEIFRRREMLLKNAFMNAVISLNSKTKKESKQVFQDLPEKIKSIGNKQVKELTLTEISDVISSIAY